MFDEQTMIQENSDEPIVYQGQFGEFTIDRDDRLGVAIYRGGLAIAAACFAVGTTLVLWQGVTEAIAPVLTGLYGGFSLALGVSLLTIHIYLVPLHRLLQLLWGVGAIATVWAAVSYPEALVLTAYQRPIALFGMGFTFVALTGIYFKEAFCFNRLETKILTPVVPILILGHLFGLLPAVGERALLALWAVLFVVFALRKAFQAMPDDIGDKTVFEYLKQQRSARVPS